MDAAMHESLHVASGNSDAAPDITGPSGNASTAGTALSTTLTICNRRGLHARAAARFVALAERFGASVDVVKDGQEVSARSIMGLMMLGAGKGSTIELRADGWDAKEALEALAELVEAGFHEQD
jgi:phosphocarrier protein